MTVTLSAARYREHAGRDSLERASVWQGNALAFLHLNQVRGACGAATGTTTSKVKSATTVAFTVGGKFFSKAATDDLWTLSGAVVAASSWQKYALCIDDSGAASIQEATQSLVSAAAVVWDNVVGNAKAPPKDPYAALISILNGSKAIFAILTVATDATHTFTPGTTLLGAAGITATYNDGLDPALFPVLKTSTGLVHGLDV